jgi:hemerythrin-like domain-containing protein
MTALQPDPAEGLHMYDELLAVHTILRRGSELIAQSLKVLADDGPVDVRALVSVARWHNGFLHHHHRSEDAQFWPLLRRLFPGSADDLTRLTQEHEELDANLTALSDAIGALGAARTPAERRAAVQVAATRGYPKAVVCRDALGEHLDDEEPVLRALFPQVSAAEIRTLRAAIVAAAPKSGPDLVLGLLSDPTPAPGYDAIVANFPPPVRWLRPVLLRRYHARRKALGVA